MAATIYYFTGTGNSLALARALAGKMNGITLKSIPCAVREGQYKCDDEVIGFVYPLYYYGLPKIVREFAGRLELSHPEYVFSVVNSGGPLPGVASYQLQRIFGNSVSVNAFHCVSVANYLPMYDVASAEKQQKILAAAEVKIRHIAGCIDKRVRRPAAGLFSGIAAKIIEVLLYKRWLANVSKKDERFLTNDKCIGCGICSGICPAGNIVMEKVPVWQHHCQECLACLHWCPQMAVQIGGKTQKRHRYHNPAVNLADMKSSR